MQPKKKKVDSKKKVELSTKPKFNFKKVWRKNKNSLKKK